MRYFTLFMLYYALKNSENFFTLIAHLNSDIAFSLSKVKQVECNPIEIITLNLVENTGSSRSKACLSVVDRVIIWV